MTGQVEGGGGTGSVAQQEEGKRAEGTVQDNSNANEEALSGQVEEEPLKDDEGLLLKYDVVICGTGLVQSILASALTRAGKTVLHCDGNDHYGELDTVWTFDYLQGLIEKQHNSNDKTLEKKAIENAADDDINNIIALSERGSCKSLKFHSSGSNTQFPVAKVGTTVQTPYGQGKVSQIKVPLQSDSDQNGHVAISLDNWTMADGSHPSVYVGISRHQLDEYHGNGASPEQAVEALMRKQYPSIQSARTLAARQILQRQSRSLAVDVTPQLLYASGKAVQGFLTSGVAEHLEFQTMQAVYWFSEGKDSNKTKAFTLERVPCSKGDVFQSPLLPPLDKRRFMKFFQLAMDYATEREVQQSGAITAEQTSPDTAADGDSTEEGVLSLNERQLNQGRSLARPQNKAVSQKDLTTLHECMDNNMDFDTYLQEHAKLSPQLRQLIRHALALEIGSENDIDSTVNLSTTEGMGRLCDHLKALGRYGTTAFLTPLYGAGEMSQFFCRSAAVYGATYLLRRAPTQVRWTEETDGTKRVESVTIRSHDEGNFGGIEPVPKEKKIQAARVVIAQEARLHATNQKRLVRRVSVVRGNIVPDTTRSVIVIPPHCVGNHKYAIHGLVLDESARVCPVGCSLLHLTSLIDESDAVANASDDDLGCLEKASQLILGSALSSQSEPAIDEIYHATFSYAIYDGSDVTHIEGLHEIGRPPMPLVVDEAFEQAQGIFRQICGPEEVFLALSPQMEAKLKEQLRDAYRGPNQVEDDDEQHVLESAMDML